MPTSQPVDGAQEFGPREQLAIWLLLGSAFTVILNETIMGVALPKLMDGLGITAAAGQWLGRRGRVGCWLGQVSPFHSARTRSHSLRSQSWPSGL